MLGYTVATTRRPKPSTAATAITTPHTTTPRAVAGLTTANLRSATWLCGILAGPPARADDAARPPAAGTRVVGGAPAAAASRHSRPEISPPAYRPTILPESRQTPHRTFLPPL